MARSVVFPLTVSLLLHAAILLLLLFHIGFAQEPLPPVPPMQIIQAKLVKLDAIPQAKPAPSPKPVEPTPPPPKEEPQPEPKPEPKPVPPPPPKPDVAKQKAEKEKAKAEAQQKALQLKEKEEADKALKLEKEKAEKEKAEKEKAEKEKAEKAEAQKKAEQEKQEAERKRKEDEDRKRKEQEKLEAQRKKQQEDLRKKQEEQQRKNDLARAMAQEDEALSAANDQEAVTSYIALIQKAIQDNWSRPPSARRDMQVTLLIQLIPTGEVINVSVVNSSGNSAFDLSAQNAVKRAAKFPELQNLKINEFEKNFRRLTLVFRPEDLRQ